MKVIFILSFVALNYVSCFVNKSDEIKQKTTLNSTTASFASAFLKWTNNISGNSSSNVFFSPTSIVALLGMLYAGADGRTRDQIGKSTFNDLTEKDILARFKFFSDSVKRLKANDNLSLKSANCIFVNDQVKNMTSSFVNVLSDNFDASAKTMPFADAESARSKINGWVEEQTDKKIKELFPQGAITPTTSMVLANAVYFLGKWTVPFKASETKLKAFYTEISKSKEVMTMSQTSTRFLYSQNDDAKAVGLPYADDADEQYFMYFIVPTKRFGLKELEAKMNPEILLKLLSSGRSGVYEVSIELPRFKMEKQYDLADTFKSLEMSDMFISGAANFSKISEDSKGYFVSAATHKAFVQVNEEGTKAGAASGASIDFRMLPEKISFIVNQPFLFAVAHRKTQEIIFFGRQTTFDNIDN